MREKMIFEMIWDKKGKFFSSYEKRDVDEILRRILEGSRTFLN